MADEQDNRSLIGQKQIRQEVILSRIEQLSDVEDRLGFVYVGEKKWLADRLAGDAELSYGDWVFRQLNEIVFPKGLDRRESGITMSLGECFTGYTEDTSPFWRPTELIDSIIRFEYVDLWMPVLGAALSELQLCQAFESLHDIAYHLYNAGLLYSHLYDELTFRSLAIDVDGRGWNVDLLNDYGSVGLAKFVGRDIRPLGE
ncbi:MAG: hypothetical protein RIC55_19290 [Pirellulaceae bacterium]